MEKVSIIIPVYNAENNIERAIESLLSQEYTNIEIIIIDDNSTDNTFFICKKYLYQNKNKIKLLKNDFNMGVSFSRNIGIDNATGKYLMFLDSDDKYKENCISTMVENIEKNFEWIICSYERISKSNIKVMQTNTIEIKNKDNIEDTIELMFTNNLFCQIWNKIYLTNIVKKNNIRFDEKISLGEDFKFNIEYLKFVNNLKILKNVLYIYTNSVSGLNLKYNSNRLKIKLDNVTSLIKFYEREKYDTTFLYKLYVRTTFSGLKEVKKYKDIKQYLKIINKFNEKQFNFHILQMREKILVYLLKGENKIILYLFSKILKVMDYLYKKIKLGY